MYVFLVRHAIAHERDSERWPQDSLRPLTPAGERRFRKAARGLASLLPRGTVILTSPYVRARDTATLLAKAARRKAPIECAELAAGSDPRQVFGLLRGRRDKSVVLVGHEPDLCRFLCAALDDKPAMLALPFKKGGAACIEFDSAAVTGRGALRWFVPPRVLRALS